MNTALYALTCVQCGISLRDLKHLSMGLVWDMFTEYANNSCDYPLKATQADIDRL